MHKCLLVAEILSITFVHLGKMVALDEDEEALEARMALYSLALSCKAFTDIALDVLWYDISSIWPLLDCLPVEVSEDRADGTFSIDRPLAPEDFIIFQKYARRVHSVGYPVRREWEGECHALRILSGFPCEPGSGLLPNLKHIVWKVEDGESISILRYILPRALVSLHLAGPSWPQFKVSLVSFLHKYFPNLKEFHCVNPPTDVCNRISDFVCHAPNLSSIAAGPLDERAMKHLMQSTELKSFTVFLPNRSWDKVAGTFLPNLTHFCLGGSQLDKATEYLANLRLSPQQVRFEISGPARGVQVAQLLKDLVTPFDDKRLLKLEYRVINDAPYITPISYLPANALDALFKFKNLTSILLENFFAPLLNDEKVIQMAKNWPHLQELKVGTGMEWNPYAGTLVVSPMTLYGVAYIAQHCQQLRSLGLVFDPSAPLTAAVPEDWTNIQIDLLEVGVSPCPIAKVGETASLMAQLFPNLDFLGWREDDKIASLPASRSEAWDLVKSISEQFIATQDAVRQKVTKEVREELREELENMGRCCCEGRSDNNGGKHHMHK